MLEKGEEIVRTVGSWCDGELQAVFSAICIYAFDFFKLIFEQTFTQNYYLYGSHCCGHLESREEINALLEFTW